MTRVLVVGSDSREEQALLARLRDVAGLPQDAFERCLDLDQCDLLLVRDTPVLRTAALHMARKRHAMRLWMHDDSGAVHDGLADTCVELDELQIQRALAPQRQDTVPDAQPLASGAGPVMLAMRQGLQERQGRMLFSVSGQPHLLVDFEHDQMVMLHAATVAGVGLAQQLGEAFDQVALHALSMARFHALAGSLPRQPLRPLLWQVAQYGEHWADFERRLFQHAPMHLLRWPDFRVLAHQHDGFRLCSLLLKKPCTLLECIQLLDVNAGAARSFMRSAYLCGYAELGEPAPVSAAVGWPQGNAAGTLLARMWRSIRNRKGQPQ